MVRKTFTFASAPLNFFLLYKGGGIKNGFSDQKWVLHCREPYAPLGYMAPVVVNHTKTSKNDSELGLCFHSQTWQSRPGLEQHEWSDLPKHYRDQNQRLSILWYQFQLNALHLPEDVALENSITITATAIILDIVDIWCFPCPAAWSSCPCQSIRSFWPRV